MHRSIRTRYCSFCTCLCRGIWVRRIFARARMCCRSACTRLYSCSACTGLNVSDRTNFCEHAYIPCMHSLSPWMSARIHLGCLHACRGDGPWKRVCAWINMRSYDSHHECMCRCVYAWFVPRESAYLWSNDGFSEWLHVNIHVFSEEFSQAHMASLWYARLSWLSVASFGTPSTSYKSRFVTLSSSPAGSSHWFILMRIQLTDPQQTVGLQRQGNERVYDASIGTFQARESQICVQVLDHWSPNGLRARKVFMRRACLCLFAFKFWANLSIALLLCLLCNICMID